VTGTRVAASGRRRLPRSAGARRVLLGRGSPALLPPPTQEGPRMLQCECLEIGEVQHEYDEGAKYQKA
jgi:hypothetical protein